jgi:hypothetical protein
MMASLEIRIVQASPDWRGSEAETLAVMAKKEGWCRIYKYTNAYSHTDSHTHYSLIQWEEEEADLFSSPYVHNVVLAYERCKPGSLQREREARRARMQKKIP